MTSVLVVICVDSSNSVHCKTIDMLADYWCSLLDQIGFQTMGVGGSRVGRLIIVPHVRNYF